MTNLIIASALLLGTLTSVASFRVFVFFANRRTLTHLDGAPRQGFKTVVMVLVTIAALVAGAFIGLPWMIVVVQAAIVAGALFTARVFGDGKAHRQRKLVEKGEYAAVMPSRR